MKLFLHPLLFMPADPDPADGNGAKEPPAFDPAKYVSADDFGKTAAKLRGVEKTLGDLSGKTLTRESLFDVLAEAGIVEKTDDGKFRSRGAEPAGAKKESAPDPKLILLEKEVEKYRLRDETRQKELDDERAASKKQKIETTVIGVLNKAGAVRAERDHLHVTNVVQIADDGTYYVKEMDKYRNEVNTPLEEYVAKFLESNPELRRAATKEGSGTPRPGGKDANGATSIPRAQWLDMDWYAKNQAKFQSGEYTRGD